MNELNRANGRIAALEDRFGILQERANAYHAILEILLSALKPAGIADRKPLDTCSGLLGVAHDLVHSHKAIFGTQAPDSRPHNSSTT